MGNAFKAYADAGFGEDLLPILPPDAEVKPDTPMFDSLVENRGKVPGKKRRGGWVGFADWTDQHANADDHRIWAAWGAGVGMQGRRFPALDIDVDDEELANAIHKAAASALGDAPTRFGRGSRRILVYAGADFAKQRLAFRRAEGHADPSEGSGARDCGAPDRQADDVLDQANARPRAPVQAVEFLASGQQYVLEGIHPKTGQPYWWRDDRSPATTGPKGLTVVDGPAIDAFFNSLEGLLDLFGYEIVSRSALGGHGDVWQAGLLAPSLGAIERALAALENTVDYDRWLKIGAAVKAAAGTEDEAEAFALWEDWSLTYGDNTPEMVLAKWQSLHPPYKVGWDFLQRTATYEGDGSFYGAAEEFDAVEPTPSDEELAEAKDIRPLTAMFKRYVWVESLGVVADTKDGALFSREKFNVKNNHIGAPTDAKRCAWAVLTSSVSRLQTARALTYRPGGGLFVDENLPGLTGKCVNMWRPTPVELPSVTRHEDVERWLDHVAFILPIAEEREAVLNWLAWIIQNPGEKPNWALVLGSTAEGIGKDLMLAPVRAALGAANIREIDADDLASGYTDYLAGTRLLIVEEMQMHERKAMTNRLKPLIAAPPYTLRVNVKYQPQYEIPNLIATIFFTNMNNALALAGKDRRYFVTWNDSEPKADAYYTDLVKWFAAGGAAHAARWLLDRDVSGFSAKGRAPMTAAKEDMRKASRPPFDEALEEAIANHEGPFAHRLFTVDQVVGYLEYLLGDRPKIMPRRVSDALKRLGFDRVRRQSLGIQPRNTAAPHLRDVPEHQVFAWTIEDVELTNAEVCEAFWADRVDLAAMPQ